MKQIKNIAISVRDWAETYAQENNKFPSDLEGMCAICSVKIFNQLKEFGYSPVLCMSYYTESQRDGAHVFIIVNGLLVDVTATQFSLKHQKVIVREKLKKEDEWYWSKFHKFRTSNGLIKKQHKDGWSMHQIKTTELE